MVLTWKSTEAQWVYLKRLLQINAVYTELISAQSNVIAEVSLSKTSNASLMRLELNHINCFWKIKLCLLTLAIIDYHLVIALKGNKLLFPVSWMKKRELTEVMMPLVISTMLSHTAIMEFFRNVQHNLTRDSIPQ